MGEAVFGSRLDRLARAQEITGRLRERGITHRQIAREVGVSAVLVSNWAKGKTAPRPEQLAALRELIRGSFSPEAEHVASDPGDENKQPAIADE